MQCTKVHGNAIFYRPHVASNRVQQREAKGKPWILIFYSKFSLCLLNLIKIVKMIFFPENLIYTLRENIQLGGGRISLPQREKSRRVSFCWHRRQSEGWLSVKLQISISFVKPMDELGIHSFFFSLTLYKEWFLFFFRENIFLLYVIIPYT